MTRGKVSLVFIINILIMCFAGNFFVIEKFQAMKTTIYVSDSNTIGPWNGTQNYPLKTVQEGITAANAGDTVLVLS